VDAMLDMDSFAMKYDRYVTWNISTFSDESTIYVYSQYILLNSLINFIPCT